MEPAPCMSPPARLPATISSTLQIPQPTNKHTSDVSLRGKQIRNETMPPYKPQLRDKYNLEIQGIFFFTCKGV
jgi:hypothetical protein